MNELVKTANIESPFDKDIIESIVIYADEWIENANKGYDLL